MNYSKLTDFNGTPVAEISAGGYTAMIAYELGSNVIRLHDDKNGIEFFRFKKDNPAEVIKQSAEVWGLPSLYLPNRFADGVLKTSDAVYQLPVNEKAPYNNHIHGFLQKRVHTLAEHYADDNCAVVKTKYRYDENDEFFQYFPVRFLAEFTFTLSECGLEHKIKLNGTDLEYINGGRKPVLQNVDNEMYVTGCTKLNGQDFHGVIAEDTESGKKIAYEVSDEYKFWIIWNDKGFNGYFCPEPMTAMIDAPNLSMPAEMTGYREIKPQEAFEANQRFFTVI